MTDEELKSILASLPRPPADAFVCERALDAALDALPRRTAPAPVPLWRWSWPRPAVFAASGICLLLIVALGFWTVPQPSPQPALAHLMREMSLLFPGQINALIMEGERTEVDVSEFPQLQPEDQCILVTLRRGGEDINVLCFSGHTVTLPGGNIRVQALLDGQGQAFAVVNDSLVNSATGTKAAGYFVRCTPLDSIKS